MKNQFNQLITNQFESRGIELFVNQNVENQWLSADDVASWMFETNAPTNRQLNLAIRFLDSASIENMLGSNPRGILEQSIKTIKHKRGNRFVSRTKPVYRLVDVEMINEEFIPEPLEVTLDRASSTRQERIKEDWQAELDSLPF